MISAESAPRAGERDYDGLHHEALFYEDERQFLDGTLPLIREGVEAGDPVMVIVSEPKIELLREELGDAAEAVEFADMGRLGRNPTRLISVWRDFIAANMDAAKVYGIGEPVWHGRSDDELAECSHHEALLNRAFDGGPPLRLMCPYDAAALDPEVLGHALRNHPWVVDATGTRTSDTYLEPELMPDPLSEPLAPPPADAERFSFSSEAELAGVREFVRESAAASGLPANRCGDAVFAINELAGNSVQHGAGAGTVYAWRRPGAVVFEVRDWGRIPDAMLGRTRPGIHQESGRGLWLVNELCDLVQVRSGAAGTSVRLWLTTD